MSVRLSVALIDSGSRFAAERPVGRRHRSIAAGVGAAYQLSVDICCRRSAANAGSVMLRAEGRGSTQTWHYTRRSRLSCGQSMERPTANNHGLAIAADVPPTTKNIPHFTDLIMTGFSELN